MTALIPEQRLAEGLRKNFILVFKKHHMLLPTGSYLDDLMQFAQRYALEREVALLQEWKAFFSDVTTPRTYIDFESWADDAIERRKSQSEQKASDHE